MNYGFVSSWYCYCWFLSEKKVSSFSFICLLFFPPFFIMHHAAWFITRSVCSPPFQLIIMIMTRCYCKWCDMGFWICSLTVDLFLPKNLCALRGLRTAQRGGSNLSKLYICFAFQHFLSHFIYLLQCLSLSTNKQ